MTDPAPQLDTLGRSGLNDLLTQLTNNLQLDPYTQALPGVRQGAFEDPTKNKGGKGFSAGTMAQIFGKEASLSYQYKKYQGRQNDKKEREAAQQAHNDEVTRYHGDVTNQIEMVKDALRREDLRDQINQQYSGLNLDSLYDGIQKDSTKAALDQITQQYKEQGRQSAFDLAGRGLQGSSVDVSQRGDIAQGQQAAGTNAASQIQGYVSGLKQNNEQEKQRLLSTVNGDNPNAGAGMQGQIQQIQNQTQSYGQQLAGQVSGMQINQAGLNGQSQALGNLLSNYATMYRGQSQMGGQSQSSPGGQAAH